MKRTLRSTSKDFKKVIAACEDPIILDLRKEKDEGLHAFYQTDYKWYPSLLNRGETIVILGNKEKASHKIQLIVGLADKFEREVVVVSDDTKHYEVIEGMIHAERKRRSSL